MTGCVEGERLMTVYGAKPGKRQAERVHFLGLRYDVLEEQQTVDLLLQHPAGDRFAFVVTPNADHLVRIDQSGAEVRQAYLDAFLCLNDSRIVGFQAKVLGVGLTTVPGADLVRSLFHSPDFDPNAAILIVGGTEDLFNSLVAKFGLKNAKHFNAPMGLLRDKEKFDATVQAVETSAARFTFLAVGSPQQELIAHAIAKRGKATGVGLCIGAAIEFLVYPQRRAPRWMSRMGLEWFFRLVREPRRLWRRYLVDSPKLFQLVYRQWRTGARPHD
jgi:exopolysaccharide biosynthesis WecB/TagA/CpsF family protein